MILDCKKMGNMFIYIDFKLWNNMKENVLCIILFYKIRNKSMFFKLGIYLNIMVYI